MQNRLLIFILILLPFSKVIAQPCYNPMHAEQFRQKLHQLALQPNDQQKLNFAKNVVSTSCLLSSQVREFAMAFGSDYYRFEFCSLAWRKTFDPVNFFDVYDAFTHFSSALRLYHYANSQVTALPVTSTPPPPPANWYPDLPYPSYIGYKGMAGCPTPLADRDFEILSRSVVMQNSDAGRSNEIVSLSRTQCLSVSQLMKLATLIGMESNRMNLMKSVFRSVYDLENCVVAAEVFSHAPYRQEWGAFCSSVLPAPVPAPEPVPVCEITAAEFSDIKKSIAAVSVNSTRLTLAKQILSTKKCFTVRQIGDIMNLFSIESSRLEISLFAWDFCINRDNYYQLTEYFSTTSSKNKLLEFINSKN
jgi:hypothetical protein